jgi:hypothetical protein
MRLVGDCTWPATIRETRPPIRDLSPEPGAGGDCEPDTGPRLPGCWAVQDDQAAGEARGRGP